MTENKTTKKTTKKKTTPKKKDEEQVMFPEVEVAGYKIKPWSFGTLFEISSSIEEIITKMKEREIPLPSFEEDFFGLNFEKVVSIFTIASPHVLDIIARTVGTDKEEIRDLSMTDGVSLALAIYSQNMEIIKNLIAPFLKMGETEEEGKEAEMEQTEEKTD